MTSKKMIVDIQCLINEHYSDKEPLNESQQKSKECFNRYCDIIEKDLEVLELIKKEFGGFIGYFLEDYLGELELNYNQVKIREWLQDEQFCIKNDEKYKFFKEWLENE